MRLTLFVSLLCASLTAQTPDKFEIYPDTAGTSTSYVDRMNLGVNAGELLMEVPDKRFRGVGDIGTTCAVDAFVCTTSDLNAATQETYSVVLRRPIAAGAGPDPSAAGVITRIGPLVTPVGTGHLGWTITTNFASPLAVPCEGGWFMGIAVGAAPAWQIDGQTLYMAFYPGFFNPVFGDNPRPGAPNHAWWIQGATSGLSQYSHTVRVGVLTRGAVLNIGGIDPGNTRQLPQGSTNFGAGGMYPNISGTPRQDGIEVRVRDSQNSGGSAFLILSTGYLVFPGGLAIGGIGGRLWLDLTALFALTSAPITSGVAIVPVVPAGVLSPALMGFTAYFQAITIDSTLANARFTNAASVSF